MEIGSVIEYPTIFWKNNIEDAVKVYFYEDSIILVQEYYTLFKEELLAKSFIERLSSCNYSEFPDSFLIDFRLGPIDTFYIIDSCLFFQKKGADYDIIPASSTCYIYNNSKFTTSKAKTTFKYNRKSNRKDENPPASKAILQKGRKLVFQYHFKDDFNPHSRDGENEK